MGYAFNTSEPGVIRAGFASAQPLAGSGVLMELAFNVVGTLQTPASVSLPLAKLNEGRVPATAQGGVVRDTTAPFASLVQMNDRPDRGVGAIDPGGAGVHKVGIAFAEPVDFTLGDVTVEKVTFPGGVETVGETVVPLSISGSGTGGMTLTFAPGSAVDTWLKVTLNPSGIVDKAGNALTDGPTVRTSFYVGSLRGDFNGDLSVGPDDLAGFKTAWRARNLDADFRGAGFNSRQPDGRVTLADVDAFTSIYQAALASGRHLDPLPAGVGSGAASTLEPLMAVQQPASDLIAALRREGGVTSAGATRVAGTSSTESALVETASPLDVWQPQESETALQKLGRRTSVPLAAGIALRIQ
jgi:hypothetical protein